MEKIDFQSWLDQASTWLSENVFQLDIGIQFGVVLGLLVFSYAITKKPRRFVEGYITRKWDKKKRDHYNEEALIELFWPVTNVIFLALAIAVSTTETFSPILLIVITKLLLAWIIIRFFTSMIRIHALSKVIATFAWSAAALSIIGKLDPTLTLLESFAFSMGESKISALTVIKGIITFTILLWIVGMISRMTERKIKAINNITPSARVLLTKTIKVALVTLAILIGIDSIGIDLTVLTVFGGAIGLGLGFGLQKIVSNLVCGVILLLDRSIKPGDVIEVDQTYGEVNSLGARYVSVITRDGFEHLIPNESLITEKVVNWSYSNPNVRLKVPVSVSYKSDLRLALKLIDDCAFTCDRVLKSPVPASRVIDFEDSGIKIELRVWIDSPAEGIRNVKSEILLSIWDAFKANDIEIPYPQREVSVKPTEELQTLIETLLQKQTVAKSAK